MFPGLPAWDPPGRNADEKKAYLWKLAESLYEGEKSKKNGRANGQLPAGYTYFGQFINHDVTFDAQSSLRRAARPEQFRSKRTPRFDLDSVYGRGAQEQPHLYCRKDPFRLLVGQTESGELDLPRSRDASTDRYGTADFDRERTALIGDPRNDDNIIISQLHLAFLRFHNERYKELISSRTPMEPHEAFQEAQKLTRWHYQWVVIHDFLARFCGAELVEEIFAAYGSPQRRILAFPEEPFVPVEFSLGVFRAGHSIVRSSYELNDDLGREIEIFGPLHPKNHLGGGRELPDRWSIQWDRFVEAPGASGNGRLQKGMAIGPTLARELRELPLPSGVPQKERSLAYVTLVRGWLLGLPSGQAVAGALGITPNFEPSPSEDPLWVYVLREAEVARRNGSREQFGPVGRRIAAEVFAAFLASDPDSFFYNKPGWRPTLPYVGTFKLGDFLENARVPMTAENWDVRRQAADLIRGLKDPVMRASG
jgi:hypothetical protein